MHGGCSLNLKVAGWVTKCCSILHSWPLFLQNCAFSHQWGDAKRFKTKLGDAPVHQGADRQLNSLAQGCDLHFCVLDRTCGWGYESAGRATTVFQVFSVHWRRCSGSWGCFLPDPCGSFNRLWNFGIKWFKPFANTTHLQVPWSTINSHCTAFFPHNVD